MFNLIHGIMMSGITIIYLHDIDKSGFLYIGSILAILFLGIYESVHYMVLLVLSGLYLFHCLLLCFAVNL